MPDKEDKTAGHPVGPDGKKLKPCCACPETKRPRDECIMEKVSSHV
jgi:cytochrome c oxidase assembly protein subunit 17